MTSARTLSIALLIALALADPVRDPVSAAGPDQRPRLFVLVTVDQLRADYLDRYGHMWSRGLRRIVDGGAVFPLTSFPYMNTVTCAGHATIGTGVLPASHGMVMNGWWDEVAKRVVSCTTDDTVAAVLANGTTVPGPGHSGRSLLMPTFADELRAQSPVRPRVVSLSLKARSAIGLAGQRGDLVLWFSPEHGWMSSAAYHAEPPDWLQQWLATDRVEADYGRQWTKLLPEAAYLWADDATGEGTPHGWRRTFPHALTSASGQPDAEFREKWEDSPFADAALTRLALRAIEALQLGQVAGRPDVLALSYSVLDHVGHAYGPRSHEVQDVLARLDQTLGDLIDALDRRVGRDRYVLALVADHGVAPIPEQMAELGLDASRISPATVRTSVDQALEPFFGPGPHVAALVYTDLYFVPGRYEAIAANAEAMQAVVKALLAVPGIAHVYRGDLIASGQIPEEPAARAVAAGYRRGRSGDLVIVPRPFWIPTGIVTTHGTFYDYDARVPIVLFGGPVRPGRYPVPTSPADIAPTLAYLAGITMARTDGRVLTEALTFEPAR